MTSAQYLAHQLLSFANITRLLGMNPGMKKSIAGGLQRSLPLRGGCRGFPRSPAFGFEPHQPPQHDAL